MEMKIRIIRVEKRVTSREMVETEDDEDGVELRRAGELKFG
jgi:hypothetical protein